MSTAVLCSTIHPQVLPYLAPFLASVARQSDADVDVWFALDGVAAGQVRELLPSGLRLRFIEAPPGVTPAEVRNVLFRAVCESYELAILVDADDDLVLELASAAGCRHIVTHNVNDSGPATIPHRPNTKRFGLTMP